MSIMDDNKADNERIECVEQLIAQLGNSTTLWVPKVVRKDQPNWKKQNPRAFLNIQQDSVQLIYEWKARDGVISNTSINNEE